MRPHVERALRVFAARRAGHGAVRVFRRVESAVRSRELLRHVVENIPRQPSVTFVAARLLHLQRVDRDLCLVVEHFFEVRHKPRRIDRVTVKPAAHVVVNPALRHLPQRVPRHLHRRAAQLRLQALLRRAPEEKREIARARKLRRPAKPAVLRIERVIKILESPFKRRPRRFREIHRRGPAALRPGSFALRPQDAQHPLALRHEFLPLLAPAFRDRTQQRRKTHPPRTVLRREIRAAVKRLQLRRQPRRERPAAVPGERLHVGHVNLVHIRPLLAVHLDGDEVFVEQRRHRRILKRLVRHHVAPVTRRVADAQKNRLRLRPRPAKRRFAPRQPIHRILRMLQQVGRLFTDERVGHNLGETSKPAKHTKTKKEPRLRRSLSRAKWISQSTRSGRYLPSTQLKINGTTIVASLSTMNFGVEPASLPHVIFSFGTAPE